MILFFIPKIFVGIRKIYHFNIFMNILQDFLGLCMNVFYIVLLI